MAEIIQPRPLTGPDVAGISGTVSVARFYAITAISSVGVPTYAAASDATGYWREHTLDYDPTLRDNAPSSTRSANNQIIVDDFTLTFTGFIANLDGVTAADPAPLIRLFSLYDLFKVVVQRGGEITTAWATRGRASEQGRREEFLQTVIFRKIWVTGVSNPTIASAL